MTEADAQVVPVGLDELGPERIQQGWDLMYGALVARGFPKADAEDVVQEAFVRILRASGDHLPRLADLENNKGWFITLAVNTYLTMLRGNRRQRRRELAHLDNVAQPHEEVSRRGPGADAIMILAEQAELTNRQRAYLQAIAVDHLGIEDIAEVTQTSPRAVRAVLQRAVERLRRQLVEAN